MTTILLIGKTGQVGWELQSALVPLGRVITLDRSQMNLVDPDAIRRAIREAAPSVIVNAAGYTAVDKAESEPDLARQINAIAPGIIGEEAKRAKALLVHYSTDYVFDGVHAAPYVEDDEPNPCNIYGKTKLQGEQAISASGCAYLILRTSWIYSKRGTNFVLTMLRLAREREQLAVVDDQIGSPTWAQALARTTVELLGNIELAVEHAGTYHLSACDYASRYEFANKIIDIGKVLSGEKTGWAIVQATTTANYPLPAKRPLNASTSKNKIKQVFNIEMPPWAKQLETFLGGLYRSRNH